MKEENTGEVDALREERDKAWLIEIRTFFDGPRWWTGAWGSRIRYESWTKDADIAVRFKRRNDAEQVIRLLMRRCPGRCIAAAHMLLDTEEARNG